MSAEDAEHPADEVCSCHVVSVNNTGHGAALMAMLVLVCMQLEWQHEMMLLSRRSWTTKQRRLQLTQHQSQRHRSRRHLPRQTQQLLQQMMLQTQTKLR